MNKKISGKKIFILDDDRDFIVLITRILEAAGAEVISATSITDAIEIFEISSPHLLLLDLNIESNNGDGLNFIDHLKTLPTNRFPAIIIISAQNDYSTVKRFNDNEISDVIVKPISSDIVLKKIKRIFAKDRFSKTLTFTPKDELEIEIVTDSQIKTINEFACFVDLPIKLAAEQDLAIEGKLFTELDMKETKMRSTGNAQSGAEQSFRNEISFVGLDEKKSAQIRKIQHFK